MIVDDHHLVAEGLRAMLSRQFDVVGMADSGRALRSLLHATEADCLLLDLAMPGTSGFELARQVRRLQASQAKPAVSGAPAPDGGSSSGAPV